MLVFLPPGKISKNGGLAAGENSLFFDYESFWKIAIYGLPWGGGPFQASNDRFPLRRIELNYIELKWVELKWNWIELNWMGGGLKLILNGIELNLKLRWTWIDLQSKRFELTLKWIEFDRIEMKLNWFWIEIEKNILFRFEIELNRVEWNWINSVWHWNKVKLSSTEWKSNWFEIDIEINRV